MKVKGREKEKIEKKGETEKGKEEKREVGE